MKRLEGKVAVVTGGNSGIGRATAREFSEQGARVVISGRDQQTLDEAKREIGGDVLTVKADVSDLADTDRLFAVVKEKFGKVDVLFVNAGVGKFAPLEAVTEEFFDEIMDINFKGAYFTIQKALPFLNDNTLSRTLSSELVARGIRVKAVSPGPVTTPIVNRMGLPPEQLQQIAEGIQSQVPMKRFGTPEEIAKTVLFLASSDSSFLLGTEIVADGGMSQL